jgi:serine protease Do
MRSYFIKGLALAALVLGSAPAVWAQHEKTKEKEKDKDVQQIIITRSGDSDEKTVIEIQGDKVLVNGKEAGKNDDVKVRVHKLRDVHALARTHAVVGDMDFDFDFEHDNDDDGPVSLWSVDSNRAMLGVITNSHDDGAEVSSVSKGSAAEKAGLKKGDVIKRIGDKKIENAEDVTDAVRSRKPGDKVEIEIIRDDKEQKLTAELGRWKGVRMSAIAPTMPRFPEPGQWRMENFGEGNIFIAGQPKLGLSVQDTEEGKGVKVVEVDEDGSAAKAGVKEDDVITHFNDKEVNSADEVARLMRESRNKPSVSLKLLRNGKSQHIEVRVPRKLKTADL